MENSVNYTAIIMASISSMILGSIWYGPLFGKKWMEIVGTTHKNEKERKEMQKAAVPLYLVQFIVTLFQVLILAHLIADTTQVTGIERALWLWAGFVIPTLMGAVMWTNEKKNLKWARFLIQGGYQLILFIIFGTILQLWK